ncbi:hypothetical protein Bca52824_002429 [Brassica carinata]|uniref:Peptidase A1 domain-containing protein n=1 Tax=Brassica carinata TaxID=52824 RepID=A0A8X7WK62_BRACI|nr:hypothetical protein Bca52824_002429 [Brassica carinata]
MSYCFSGEGTSKLNFGSNAIVSGDGTVSANMFKKEEDPNMYYLNLDAVSVGKTRIETLGTPFHALNGNMIIDSGTTYTFLRKTYYDKVRKAVENIVKADREASPEQQALLQNEQHGYLSSDHNAFPRWCGSCFG